MSSKHQSAFAVGAAVPTAPFGSTNEPGQLQVRLSIDWLKTAARLPGKSLHVGVALVITAGSNKLSVVPLSNILSLQYGLERNSKNRGLAWLEHAGLVIVERRLGRAPLVKIVELAGSDVRQP